MAGGMKRLGQGDCEVAEARGAAGVQRLDRLDPLLAEPADQLEGADDLAAMLPGDVDGVTDMVEVAVAQDDMGDARNGAVDIALEMRITGQERVDCGEGLSPTGSPLTDR